VLVTVITDVSDILAVPETSEIKVTYTTCNNSQRGTTLGHKSKVKGKAVPLQAWSVPEGSGKLRFPDFMTTAQEGGKVVSLTHLQNLPPGNSPGTHFC
jgi:hypothetical protein